MAANFTIDQAGLPAGTLNTAREDGLATGAQITITTTEAGTVELVDVPVGEGNIIPTVTGNPLIWVYTPTAAKYGTYLFRLTVGVDTNQYALVVRTPNQSFTIPGWNEISDTAGLIQTAGATQIAASNNNVGGNVRGWAPALSEVVLYVDGLSGATVTMQLAYDGGSDWTADATEDGMVYTALLNTTPALTILGAANTGQVAANARVLVLELPQSEDEVPGLVFQRGGQTDHAHIGLSNNGTDADIVFETVPDVVGTLALRTGDQTGATVSGDIEISTGASVAGTTGDVLLEIGNSSGGTDGSVMVSQSGGEGRLRLTDSGGNFIGLQAPSTSQDTDYELPAARGSAGQVLSINTAAAVTTLEWTTPAGSGDVLGPASATDNALARYDLTTGKLLQDSLIIVTDAGAMTGMTTVDGRDLAVDGTKLDGIEALADVTDATNVAAAGAVMSGDAAGGDLNGTYPNPLVDDGADSTAIHDNVAAEISVITEKVSPISADLVIIEDSAAGNAKRRVQLGNLPGGGTGDVVGPASATDEAIARYDLATGKLIQNSVVLITDAGAMTGMTTVDGRDLAVDGTKLDGIEALADVTDATNVAAAGAVMSGDTAGGDLNGTYPNPLVDDGADSTAIHDNVASEISVVTEKVTPVSGDFLLIEDSAAANVKKRIQVGNLPSSSGDVVGPASSTDNALVRFNLASGTLIQDSNAILEDNGALTLTHVAAEADDSATTMHVDGAGFGDIKAIDINFTAGAIGAGTDAVAGVLVNVDETATGGGRIAGLEVVTTGSGSAEVDAMEAGVGVHPVIQLSGVFVDADTVLVLAVDQTTALSGGGAGNITVFVADNDTITVGSASTFQEIEIVLDTAASQNCQLTFEISTGIGTWTAFTPTDSTNGFLNTGEIIWLLADVPTWATGTGGEYLIRITRTRNGSITSPIVDLVQVADAIQYGWDKDGAITALSVDLLATNGDATGFIGGATGPGGSVTYIMPVDAPSSGEVLSAGTTGGGTNQLTWETAAGSGDVVGPASATNEAVARFDTTTGKLIQDSIVLITDAGAMTGMTTVDGRDLAVDGTKLDGIEALADVTDATNVAAAGAVMSGDTAGGDLNGTYPNPSVDDGADSTAIHDNVASEISVITEKVTPVSGDFLIIEDSAAGNVKKRLQVGNLPSPGGSLQAAYDTATKGVITTSATDDPLVFTGDASLTTPLLQLVNTASSTASLSVYAAAGPEILFPIAAVAGRIEGEDAAGGGGLAGVAISITAGAGDLTAAGGTAELVGGTGGATGSGADVTLAGGVGGATSGNGGDINFLGGSVPGSAGVGGEITGTAGSSKGANVGGPITLDAGEGGATGAGGRVEFTSGDGGSTSGAGGAFIATAGNAAGSGIGGALTLTSGDGASAAGGALTLTSGVGNGAAAGGLISLVGGAGGATGAGASVTITGGAGGSTSGAGGDVSLVPGNVTSGTIGAIIVERASTTAAELRLIANDGDITGFVAGATGPGDANVVYILPVDAPTSGEVLSAGTTAAGRNQLTWETWVSATMQLAYNGGNVITTSASGTSTDGSIQVTATLNTAAAFQIDTASNVAGGDVAIELHGGTAAADILVPLVTLYEGAGFSGTGTEMGSFGMADGTGAGFNGVLLQGADGTTGNYGGIRGGQGTATGGTGVVRGGTATDAGGTAGDAAIQGGTADGATATSGSITITTLAAHTPGDVVITAGASDTDSTNVGGAMQVTLGAGANATAANGGVGGAFTLTAGAGGTATGANSPGVGGAITLTAGAAGTGGDNTAVGADLTLVSGGSGSAGGLAGSVVVQPAQGSAVANDGGLVVTNNSGRAKALVLQADDGGLTGFVGGATGPGGTVIYILPVDAPTSGQVLSAGTTASGRNQLTWETGGGGGSLQASYDTATKGVITTSATDDPLVFTGDASLTSPLLQLVNTASATGGLSINAGSGPEILFPIASLAGRIEGEDAAPAGGLAGVAVTITGGAGDLTAAGGNTEIAGGTGGATGAGGNTELAGGSGGATSGNGGDIDFFGGPVPGTSGVGGAITGLAGNSKGASVGGITSFTSGDGGATGAGGRVELIAGVGGSTSGAGGAVTLTAGDADGSGIGGAITLTSGTGAGAVGGATVITAGAGDGANAGGVASLIGGAGGATGAGGASTITGGAGGATSGNGGDINLVPGDVTSGTIGAVKVERVSTTAAELQLVAGNGDLTGFVAGATGPGVVDTVYVLPIDAPTVGQVLSAAAPSGGRSVLSWDTAAGSGDVVGPASATNNALARYDTTTGKLLQDSLIDASDTGTLTINASANPSLALPPVAAGAGNTGEARFLELVASGTNYTGFKAPDALGANLMYTLPSVAPTASQVLSSTAGGVLSWATASGGDMQDAYDLDGDIALGTVPISWAATAVALTGPLLTLDSSLATTARPALTLEGSGTSTDRTLEFIGHGFIQPANDASGDGRDVIITGGLSDNGFANSGFVRLNGAHNFNGGTAEAGGVVITGGGADGTSPAGFIDIKGGSNGDTGAVNTGGAVTLTGGNARTPGDVTLVAGNSNGGNTAGGGVTATAGVGNGTGAGGPVTSTGGVGGSTSGTGGANTVAGGAGTGSGAGGALNLDGGTAGATGVGGDTTITSGNGGSTSGNAGNIHLAPGTATSGTDGNIDANDSDIIDVKTLTHIAVPTDAAPGATPTISFAASQFQEITLSAAITAITITAPPGPGILRLRINQPAGTNHTVTGWPGTVEWEGGTAPTITATNGATDIIELYWDGAIYFSKWLGNFS